MILEPLLRRLAGLARPPSPSAAGRALSAHANRPDARARRKAVRRAQRDRLVKAHCAAILASMKLPTETKEPAE